MDFFDDGGSSGKVEDGVHDLLEEGWFFGKLLIMNKPKMSRCYSDPSPNFGQENSRNERSSPARELPGKLLRAPSLPPFIGGQDDKMQEDREQGSSSSGGLSKLTGQLSLSDQVLFAQKKPPTRPSCAEEKEGKTHDQENNTRRSKMIARQSLQPSNVLRTPSSPPPCSGRELEVTEENEGDEITMSRLIRQAMPNSFVPPLHVANNKAMLQSSSMPKCRPPRKSEADGIGSLCLKETRQQRYPTERSLKKSLTLSDLEFQEVQGFKDLGFTFDRKDMNPSVVSILPGLQDKKNGSDPDQDYNNHNNKVRRRPYLSEAWHVHQSCAPKIPICLAKNSAEDMKAQLKFWARAVASNVR